MTFQQALSDEMMDIYDLIIKKQKDYGHGNILAFGEYGILVRLSDKIERLKNLWKSGAKPENEAAEDTWRDIAGYVLLRQMLVHGTFESPME